MADTEAPKDPSVLDEARNLLVQGKRSMALEDYQSATDSLEQAVQLFDAYYGVAKIECADAYLEYGLALVALANLEAGSGTDRLMKKAGIEHEEEGEEDEDDEDDEQEGEEEDEEKVESGEDKADSEDTGSDKNQTDATASAGATSNGLGEEKKENGISTNGHSDEVTKTNGAGGTSRSDNNEMQVDSESEPMPGTSSGAGTSGGGDNKDEDDVENEEATTIEIAWEVLCLAKRLFMTDESLDGRLKLAETLQKLGEISIEWDNNDNAVSILEECLNIRKAILPAEDRLIALTYYHLGLAHSFKSETQNANENFQNAINVIEKRIESLNKDLDKAKAGEETMAASAYEREINELKELLPEINMRVDDSKEDVSTSSEAIKRTRDEIQQEDEEAKKVCLDKSKAADDISHLVKRKAA